MTVSPQGKIILCNVPFESNQEHQLTFSSLENQYNYFYSKSVLNLTDQNYTFIRQNNQIKINVNSEQLYSVNYIMYQNVGFTTKWFYAFITAREYINENTVLLTIETDVIQTWYFEIDYSPCFVEREHVNNDTIGIHTVPENLEFGEITLNESTNINLSNAHAVVCLTEDIVKGSTSYPYQIINGIPTGLHYYVIGNFTSVNGIGYITDKLASEGKLDSLVSIFMVPDLITGYASESSSYWSYFLTEGGLNYAPYHKMSTIIMNSIDLGETSISKPYSTINGYTPKNNKLFVYPYNYLLCDNNGGSSNIYKYEDFQTSDVKFETYGDITPGCSIRTIPKNYKNIGLNNSEGINACKFPVCSWNTDVYTNWLTQNSLNIGTSLVSSGLGVFSGAGLIASGATMSGVSSIVSSSIAIANTLGTVYQHSLLPLTIEGNINSGDVTYSTNLSNFTFYKASIKNEYATIIDNYFSMYGYKVNIVKIPNINGRTNWNYIKTIGCTFNGDIPDEDMNKIKRIFNDGITFWHNPNNIYNYSLNNGII